MASISVNKVVVLDNPSTFLSDFKFEIQFECIAAISDDLEWKVVYVGSASGPQYDQELDSVLVGPVPIGTSRFILQTPHPNPSKIPEDDLVGATVIMIQCFYKNREFIRIGYYISHEYSEPLNEGEEIPKPVPLERIKRVILAERPRVTQFPIEWDAPQPDKDALLAPGNTESAGDKRKHDGAGGDDGGRR